MLRENIVITFITIIYGIMLTDLFLSVHKLIKSRPSVKWHWLPLLSAWYLFLIILKNWWDLTFFQGSADWMNILYFLAYGHLLLLIFLSVSTVLPDSIDKNGIDLKHYYFKNHRYFWGLMTAVVIFSNVIRIFKDISIFSTSNLFEFIVISIFILLLAGLAITKKYLIHAIVVVVLVAMILLEIIGKMS
ncbi:hypothetical protein JW948_13755 [bacterium]|nr:hypothetical protein [bacterium]